MEKKIFLAKIAVGHHAQCPTASSGPKNRAQSPAQHLTWPFFLAQPPIKMHRRPFTVPAKRVVSCRKQTKKRKRGGARIGVLPSVAPPFPWLPAAPLHACHSRTPPPPRVSPGCQCSQKISLCFYFSL